MRGKLYHLFETKYRLHQRHKERVQKNYGALGVSFQHNGCAVQTVTRNGCIGFCKTTCGFCELQMRLVNVATRMKTKGSAKFFFFLKVQSFRLIMENNSIQEVAVV